MSLVYTDRIVELGATASRGKPRNNTQGDSRRAPGWQVRVPLTAPPRDLAAVAGILAARFPLRAGLGDAGTRH